MCPGPAATSLPAQAIPSAPGLLGHPFGSQNRTAQGLCAAVCVFRSGWSPVSIPSQLGLFLKCLPDNVSEMEIPTRLIRGTKALPDRPEQQARVPWGSWLRQGLGLHLVQ